MSLPKRPRFEEGSNVQLMRDPATPGGQPIEGASRDPPVESAPGGPPMEGKDAPVEDVASDSSEEGDDVTVQVDRFFSELDIDYSKQKRRLFSEGSRMYRRKNVLPPHLHSVMGSANLRLARGDSGGAIELCMEVIRQVPHSPEPYLTLATVYEDRGDGEKLLQILLIVAHLKRSDAACWTKTAELAMERNNPSLAVQCFSKASRLDPGNLTLVRQKASVYVVLGDCRKALEAYEQLLQALPRESGQDYIDVAKEIARLYHKLDETAKAISILQQAVQAHPSHVEDETINLLSELYIVSKMYTEAYQAITQSFGMLSSVAPETARSPSFSLTEVLRMTMSSEGDEVGDVESSQSSDAVVSLVVPEEVPVDLRTKLAVCLIHMGKKVPEEVVAPIFPHPEEYGDLFLDIADAYTDNGEYSKALPLLSALVHTEKFNQAGVWLKHAECLHMLNDIETAAMSYSKVVALAPNHTETRITLATLYSHLGLVDDALALLDTDSETVSVQTEATPTVAMTTLPDERSPEDKDIRLLLHKYTLLVSEARMCEYVETGSELLVFLFRDVFHRKNIKEFMHLSQRYLNLRLRDGGREDLDQRRMLREQEGILNTHEWWKVFLTTCQGLYHLGPWYHSRLLHFIYCAKCLKRFETEDLEMAFLLFVVSVFRQFGDTEMQWGFLKQACYKYPGRKVAWNILNNSVPLDTKMQRFVLRLFFKHPSNGLLMRVSANNSLTCSSYKMALSQYELAYRQAPSDYLLSLCIGLVYLNMACQNKIMYRNALVTQALAFLQKYTRLRGVCQESMYNIGRAFHQLGISHIACHFYKQVLRLQPECKEPKWIKASDLTTEAAYNLSHIYRSSGNRTLALHILRKYCTI